jgi:rare lipoprotein A
MRINISAVVLFLSCTLFLPGAYARSAGTAGNGDGSVYQPFSAPQYGLDDNGKSFRVGESTSLTASWYGVPFHGQPTAAGPLYNMNGLTAAHKRLPFGTRLRVTYPATGKSVDVVVNDRGPFVQNRDLDLSFEAARRIGLSDDGIGAVKITFLGRDPAYIRDVIDESDGRFFTNGSVTYTLQFGAFRDRENAEKLKKSIELTIPGAYITQTIIDGFKYHRVRMGTFASISDAMARAHIFADEGYLVRVFEER